MLNAPSSWSAHDRRALLEEAMEALCACVPDAFSGGWLAKLILFEVVNVGCSFCHASRGPESSVSFVSKPWKE